MDTRPTSDRLREALFNILTHGHGDPISEARVLDLFAGTGALGLEALSRGAAFATFVDDDPASRGVIRQNVEALGAGGVTRIFRRDATRMGPRGANEVASLVFCDPPYRRGLASAALLSCAENGWLAPDATVVVEDAAEAAFVLPAGFVESERRRYGESELVLGRFGG